ncbi:MAG: hypothetical protein R6X20_10285 [Phycisphaerae bacterium]
MSQSGDEPRIIRFDEINRDPPGDEYLPSREEAAAEIYASLPSRKELESLPPAANIQDRLRTMKSLRTLLDL